VPTVAYAKLVAKTPLKIVRTEEQNENYRKVLFDLTSRKMTNIESCLIFPASFAKTHSAMIP
jgi:hypothetical protein